MNKEDLMLIVPTRGRVGHQNTLSSLPKKWLKRTRIACPSTEAAAHKKQFPDATVWVQPKDSMTIAAKRAWIFKHAHKTGYERIMMLDDDLRFSLRKKTFDALRGYDAYNVPNKHVWAAIKKKDPTAHELYTPEPDDPRLDAMLLKIETMLCFFEHGGIHPRQMNQELPGEWKMNGRAMYSLAYNVSTVLKHCELGRIEHREDIDYSLQLMRAGFPNCLYAWGSCNHYPGFGNRGGGASEERTITASNRDALRLAKLHPGLVKVVERDYKTSVARLEVIVSWQNAISAGGLL